MLERWTIGFGKEGALRKPDEIEKAENTLVKFGYQTEEWIKPFDVMLTPVMPTPAPPIGYLDSDVEYKTLRKRVFDSIAYTPIQNAIGTPAMSVPSGFSSGGLPIGSHFIARAGEEAMLFGIAFELEQLQPWYDAWPPNSVKVEGMAKAKIAGKE
jgi:amidase